MSRDTITKDIFATADDAIQGLWGFHAYTSAAAAVAPKIQLRERLPAEKFILTHEWERFYDPNQLITEMESLFEFVHCRTSLVALVSVFESAIERFITRLASLRLIPAQGPSYKSQAKWIFLLVRHTRAGSATMLERLPTTCGDVDNARRLRNSIAHNNGKYDDSYLSDAINDGWVLVQLEADSQQYQRDRWMPIFLSNSRFDHFIRSHVELLHIVHNTIQSKFFDHHEGYNYAKEKKLIEWHRLLSGKASVQM